MERDIFYDTSKLTHGQQEAVLRLAYSLCETWWFDRLDCSESWARQRVSDIGFEEAMKHFGEKALMRVIHRKPPLPLDSPNLEVGFRSMESPVDYFLWIIVPLDHADRITEGLCAMR
jgi:hypothetical protein